MKVNDQFLEHLDQLNDAYRAAYPALLDAEVTLHTVRGAFEGMLTAMMGSLHVNGPIEHPSIEHSHYLAALTRALLDVVMWMDGKDVLRESEAIKQTD